MKQRISHRSSTQISGDVALEKMRDKNNVNAGQLPLAARDCCSRRTEYPLRPPPQLRSPLQVYPQPKMFKKLPSSSRILKKKKLRKEKLLSVIDEAYR